jgi:hypothetical protein
VVKLTGKVDTPLQITIFSGLSTWAVGFTVIVNVFDGPSQVTPPFVICGTTSMVATIGEPVLFIALNDEISLPPPPNNPIEGWSFVHVKFTTSPDVRPLNITGAVSPSLHII